MCSVNMGPRYLNQIPVLKKLCPSLQKRFLLSKRVLRIRCLGYDTPWVDTPVNFREFLRKFVTLANEEWVLWERAFVRHPESPWFKRPVSVDMLKQFLTRQVTEAAVANVVAKSVRPGGRGLSIASFAVCEDDIKLETAANMTETFNFMCDGEAANLFFSSSTHLCHDIMFRIENKTVGGTFR